MYRKITFKYNEKHNCMNLSDLFINQAKELIRPSAFMSNRRVLMTRVKLLFPQIAAIWGEMAPAQASSLKVHLTPVMLSSMR